MRSFRDNWNCALSLSGAGHWQRWINIILQDPLLLGSKKAASDAGADALASLLVERDDADADDQEEILTQPNDD